MDRGELRVTVAVVAVLAVVVWMVSLGGGVKLKAQADLAASGPPDGPVTFGNPVSHGIVPEKWVPHVPRGAHLGPHRMYRHPKRCSPVLTAPVQRDYDWLYSPPSEGDL